PRAEIGGANTAALDPEAEFPRTGFGEGNVAHFDMARAGHHSRAHCLPHRAGGRPLRVRHICASVMAASVAFDEFIETARAAIPGFILMEKGEPVFVEDAEELVPADLFQRLLRFAEIYAQYAAIAGGRDLCR